MEAKELKKQIKELKSNNLKLLVELLVTKTIKDDYYECWQKCAKQKKSLEDKYSELKRKYNPSILPDYKGA